LDGLINEFEYLDWFLVEFFWVPKEDNEPADGMAKQAVAF